jgi:hypothetical protein
MPRPFSFLDDETVDEFRARQAKLAKDKNTFEKLVKNTIQIADRVDQTAQQRGFTTAWLCIMFERLDAEDRQYVIDAYIQREKELMMKRISYDV